MTRFIKTTQAAIFLTLLFLCTSWSPAQVADNTTLQPKFKSKDASVVHYSDFGAQGDGKTNDFAAIAEAHDYANQKKLPVKADAGATYYIGGDNQTVIIQTNTDFGSAKFIIDDTKLENINANVFCVSSTLKPIKIKDIKSLKKNQPKIDVKLPSTSVITATNYKVKRFIRRGNNKNSGSSQTDTFLVDKNGKVYSKTPITWDFDHVSNMTAQPFDQTELTITGGKFTTVANASDSSKYHARGILINRCNVVINGVEHYIRGEGEKGAPYRGFINISKCSNVTVKNTILTGHKTYRKIGSAGNTVSMGSYDLTLGSALNISIINCSQSNDIMDSKYWGIMGSNFCKNLTFDDCKLSRFDAHQGVTNATIRNSTMGHMGIRLTGFGTFLLENSTVHGNHCIHLREDYGSTWHGDIIIKNCRFSPRSGDSNPSIIGGWNDGQHDFGYTCYMPSNILIDKLHILDSKKTKSDKGPYVFANFNSKLTSSSYTQKHPYVITRAIKIRDVTTASGKPLEISSNPFMFSKVKVD